MVDCSDQPTSPAIPERLGKDQVLITFLIKVPWNEQCSRYHFVGDTQAKRKTKKERERRENSELI
jgi:hypothetical protein